MSFSDPIIWLLLFMLPYGAVTLYWARLASLSNSSENGFFNANGQLAPWMTALTMAGASVSGWIVLGFPEMISVNGMGFATLGVAGVVLPLAGVLFFKRQWILAKRYGFKSQGAIFQAFYGGRTLAIVSAVIAVLFAFAITGMQLRTIGLLLASLSDGTLATSTIIWVVAVFLFAYCVIGGMRAVGYLGSLQTVLLGLGIVGLAVAMLQYADGFDGLNQQLSTLVQSNEILAHRLFEISGVIQFTAGLGVEAPASNQWTAVMVLSMALALMGFQATPMATHLIICTRNARAIASGQTWVMAGFIGALVTFGIVIIGAGALGGGNQENALLSLLQRLGETSPWFVGELVICLVASVQVIAGLSLVTASNALVRDVYVPFFHKGLGKREAILYGRIVLGLLLLASVLSAILAPVSISAIGAVALPAAFQLWPALVGVCWLPVITRQAAATGAVIGIFAVVATDKLGIDILAFLGLDLPWGRWPWTIHSAAWGMFFNLLSVIIISAITQGCGHSLHMQEIRKYFLTHSNRRARSRALKPAAWSAVLAWFFLALGPGVVLGNVAFGSASEGLAGWAVGMPPLWAWTILFWMLGVFMIWFLSYKLELATAPMMKIAALEKPPRMPLKNTKMRDEELLRFVWVVAGSACLVTLTVWIFG